MPEKLKEKVKFMPNGPGYLMYDKTTRLFILARRKLKKIAFAALFLAALITLKNNQTNREIVDFSFVQTKTELEAIARSEL